MVIGCAWKPVRGLRLWKLNTFISDLNGTPRPSAFSPSVLALVSRPKGPMSPADDKQLSECLAQREELSSPNNSHRSFPELANLLSFRYVLFLAMEVAFTALAWYCYIRPRPLPRYITLEFKTVKSGFITIFNFWHTIAIACALAICADVFSREWAARPEKTDIVSTASSGIIDRVYYSFTPRATKTFKVGFVIFLGLIGLRTIGPSTVTATDGVPFDQPLNIGLINTTRTTSDSVDPDSPAVVARVVQANMIVRLEKLLGAPWGFVPPANWLIPLPTKDLNKTKEVEYETDLVWFNYTCQWQTPNFTSPARVMAHGVTWTSSLLSNASEGSTEKPSKGSSILQLRPTRRSDGTSIYLFLGGNSSFPPIPTTQGNAWLDLGGLPSAYNPDGFVTNNLDGTPGIRAPVASLLVCDSHLRFTSGTVTLSPTPNITESDIAISAERPNHVVGNIDQPACRAIFTNALSMAINMPDPGPWLREMGFIDFNSVSAEIFLKLPAWPYDWSALGPVPPLDLALIDASINSWITSALKAFTRGYRAESNLQQVIGDFNITVNARSTLKALALATSIQFAILHTILLIITVVGLATLAYLNEIQGRKPFTLTLLREEYE